MIKKCGLISIGLICLSIFLSLGTGKNDNESIVSENRDSTDTILYAPDTGSNIFRYDLNYGDRVSVKLLPEDSVVYDKVTLYIGKNNGEKEKIKTLHAGNDFKKDEEKDFLEKDMTQKNYTYFETPEKGEYIIYCIGVNESKKESFLNLDITIEYMLNGNEENGYIVTH